MGCGFPVLYIEGHGQGRGAPAAGCHVCLLNILGTILGEVHLLHVTDETPFFRGKNIATVLGHWRLN